MTEPQDSINFYMCIYTPKPTQIRQPCNLYICHSWKIPNLRKWQKQEQMSPDFYPTPQESGNSDGLLAWHSSRGTGGKGRFCQGWNQEFRRSPGVAQRARQRGCGTTHLSARACWGPLSLHPGLVGRLRRCQVLLPSHKQDVCPCCHMQSHPLILDRLH